MPEGYLPIGVAPHRKRHAAVAITQDFASQAKFKFDNTGEGLKMMLDRARVEMMKSCCLVVMFAIETGGRYRRNIAYYLGETCIGHTDISGAEGIRTPDLLLAKQALSQLSYSPNGNYCIRYCVVAKTLCY